MNSIKEQAIILRRTPFGEADVMLTLLTSHHGKLRVLAKGARRTTSRLVGHTEPFSIISGQINMQSKIPILSQVTVEETVAGLAENPLVLQRISLMAEIIDKAVDEGQATESLYQVLIEGSLRLRSNYQPMLFVGVVIRLLGLLGYAPELTQCVICKVRLEPGGRYGWDHSAGGVVSGDCLLHRATTDRVSMESVKALRHLQRIPLEEMERIQGGGEVVDELHSLVLNYTRYVLEQPIMSATVSYVDEVNVAS